MVKKFFIFSAKRFTVCILMSLLFFADISAQGYQPRLQDPYPSKYRQSSSQKQTKRNAYPSRYRQSSTQNQRTQDAYSSRYRQSSSQNQRTQDAYSSRYRQSSSQYQRNGNTRREYGNPFVKQDQNNNGSKTEKSSERSAKTEEDAKQISPSISDNKSADDVELVATGDGGTKQEATLSALRSALEQVYGTIVSSNTKILDDKLVKDEIVSITTGVIKKYNYLSEKEVGGKWYVVVNAIVSTQKLVSYAQSKGASVELAGATFATNVRLKKLNDLNKSNAKYNIREMQRSIFPTCLDYSIENMKGPFEGRWDDEIRYCVYFDVVVKLNANASHIANLEKQIQELGGYNIGIHAVYLLERYAKETREIIKSILEGFKITDNIGTYWLDEKETNFTRRNGVEYSRQPIALTRNNDYYKNTYNLYLYEQSSLNKDVIMCEERSIRCMEEEDDAIIKIYDSYQKDEYGKYIDGYMINWEIFTPQTIIFRIPFAIAYTLDELEKIKGIHVISKNG